MTELKDKLKKLGKDIKALVANQKRWKKETKDSKELKKEIKDEFVPVLERKVDDRIDTMHEKRKELHDEICVMT